MTIGKKLNLLIIGIIVSLIVGITAFVLVYLPTNLMRAEKDSLFELDSAISELRADINKLYIRPFESSMNGIVESYNILAEQFDILEDVKVLKADPQIAASVDTMIKLNLLFESNYKDLIERGEILKVDLQEVFYSTSVNANEIRTSQMIERSPRRDIIENNFESFLSAVTIIDNNLISTHDVVEEQFEIIHAVISAREKNAYRTGIIIIAVVVVLSLIAAFLIASRIVKNVRIAGEGIKRMSGGDIAFRFDIRSKDEIGELGSDLNTLTENLVEAFDSMKSGSAEGVMVKEELISSSNETSTAAAQIASTSQAIENQFGNLSANVSGATDSTKMMKDTIIHLEEYVQEQSAMVEQSTSSVTEMISSINNVADITSKKQEATEALVKTAASGGEKLNTTTSEINEITDSLDDIRGMAAIIQQIASQTNLLAMNAAIEAAHAGDAGRGFAVVADEIRKLAEASSLNSKQISGVLKEVVSRIESASDSSRETQEAFGAINQEVEGVSQSLAEIKSSMDELNVGGQQILEAMTGLQDVSVKVRQGSGDMTEASDEVSEAIETVSRITSEVSNSASEINIGINEVSSAMTRVTDLSSQLGDITDQLEEQAGKFRTGVNEAESQAVADEVAVDSGSEPETLLEMSVSSGENEAVTISGDDEGEYDYDDIDKR